MRLRSETEKRVQSGAMRLNDEQAPWFPRYSGRACFFLKRSRGVLILFERITYGAGGVCLLEVGT